MGGRNISVRALSHKLVRLMGLEIRQQVDFTRTPDLLRAYSGEDNHLHINVIIPLQHTDFILFILSLTCADLAAIVVLPITNRAERMVKMDSKTNRGALYFVTEQACCFAQARGMENEHFLACKGAAEYFAGDDTDALRDFHEKTTSTKLDPNADYDTEDYAGKERDIHSALAELAGIAKSPDTPDNTRSTLMEVAGIIAAFYDVEIPEAVPA